MKRRQRKAAEFSARTNWVRHKLAKSKGRHLRVLIYARYSTDEQDQSSIVDQVRYCKVFLQALGLAESDYVLDVLSDEGISGEKIHRPGIDRVWEGLGAGRWHLIVAEDSSRLYRDAASCVQLIRSALDQRLRVFCINDEVDTADEENWEERLFDAARHHQRTNKYTARRIKRKHEALWAMGAAIGLLKPGYSRKASQPSVDGEPEEGPYFDEIDSRWTATVFEAYERIAAQESPTSVAAWLTKRGFPKSSNSLHPAWSADNVKALIRRLDYRGVQKFRDKVSKKVWGTGCHRAEPSSADEVLTRDMPHLRIVPDWLWYAANKAIDERGPKAKVLSGVDHGLYGIPRDSRGPLSNLFRCHCCGAKMHKEVRAEGGYRCAQAVEYKCWNRATCLTKFTERPIYTTVVAGLQSLHGEIDRMLSQVGKLLGDSTARTARRAELVAKVRETEAVIRKLNDALEQADEPPESSLQRLLEREHELAELRADLEGLSAQDDHARLPTRKEIEARIAELTTVLQKADRSVRDDLQALVGTIHAVPHIQFGGNKVVLRARFDLHLAALLPARTRAALAGAYGKPEAWGVERIGMSVDLFEPSTGPRFGLTALALTDQALGLTAIGQQLGITKRQANVAVQYGRQMRAAGVTDPFHELTSCPVKASRWIRRKPQAGDGRAV